MKPRVAGKSNIRLSVGFLRSPSMSRVESPALTHLSESWAASVVFPSLLQAIVIRIHRRSRPQAPRPEQSETRRWSRLWTNSTR